MWLFDPQSAAADAADSARLFDAIRFVAEHWHDILRTSMHLSQLTCLEARSVDAFAWVGFKHRFVATR